MSTSSKENAGTPAHKRMSAAERRDQILDVARQLVADEGFAAVTMKRLAEGAGITRTVIYQQFGELPRVLVELVEREFARETAAYLQSVASHPGGGVTQFVAVMRDLLQAADANPSAWRMLLLPPEGGPPELHERLAESRGMVRAYLAESLGAAMKAGQLVVFANDMELGIHTIHVVAEELIRLHLTDSKTYSSERVLEQVKVLSEGLFR
jgi:AcrR family transcriptional regulator